MFEFRQKKHTHQKEGILRGGGTGQSDSRRIRLRLKKMERREKKLRRTNRISDANKVADLIQTIRYRLG